MRRRVMTGPKSLDVLYTYTYNSNNYHTFVAPKSAYYYVECWGGQGNYGYNDSEDRFTISNDPGYGGYVAGFIKLVGGDIIYVYCGNGGLKQTGNVVKYNYNGGGSGHSMTNEGAGRYIYEGAGGGATDLRLSNNSDPLNVDSLKTRIMVAGGGGGGCEYYFIGHGGSAGGLKAYLGGYAEGTPASQVAGGSNSGNNLTDGNGGLLGVGGGCGFDGGSYSSGGGGGFYGGPSGGISSNAIQTGGGGSSYISGHPGCVKYDKYVFTNTKMIDGNGFVWTDVKGELEKMPNPLGGLYDLGKGHIGSGYCRISIFQ